VRRLVGPVVLSLPDGRRGQHRLRRRLAVPQALRLPRRHDPLACGDRPRPRDCITASRYSRVLARRVRRVPDMAVDIAGDRALPTDLRERRRTEFLRSGNARAFTAAAGGLAFAGVAVAAVLALVAPGNVHVNSPSIIGPVRGTPAPKPSSTTPSPSGSTSPTATTSSSTAPSSTPPASTTPTPTPSPSSTTRSPTPT